MKKIILLLACILVEICPVHVRAKSLLIPKQETCDYKKLNNILNFSAYTIDSMDVAYSDFQGLSGAGNSIVAKNFYFGPLIKNHCGLSVSVKNSFAGAQGQMAGSLEVTNPRGKIRAYDVGGNAFLIPRRQYSKLINHDFITKQIYDFSDFFRNLKSSDARISDQKEGLVITLGAGSIQVVKLQADQIKPGRDLEIYGHTHQTLVLNIFGPDAEINHMLLRIHGLFIKNIIWNFTEAKKLVIANMGGMNDTFPQSDEAGHDGSMGLQGLVLAPHALTYFNSTKITGNLLVANIALGNGPTGQIDPSPDQGPLSPCLVYGNPLCRVP